MDKKNIYSRIIEFQKIMPAIKKDETNPFYQSKYATLDNIQKAIQKPLAECGLGYTQEATNEGLKTTLFDTDGNMKEFWYPATFQGKPQEIGSAMTYAKRYALTACLGLIIEGEDDDGNEAQKSSDIDNRPWLTQKDFETFKLRIGGGEDVVTELKKFKMKNEYRKVLADLIKKVKINKNKNDN